MIGPSLLLNLFAPTGPGSCGWQIDPLGSWLDRRSGSGRERGKARGGYLARRSYGNTSLLTFCVTSSGLQTNSFRGFGSFSLERLCIVEIDQSVWPPNQFSWIDQTTRVSSERCTYILTHTCDRWRRLSQVEVSVTWRCERNPR